MKYMNASVPILAPGGDESTVIREEGGKKETGYIADWIKAFVSSAPTETMADSEHGVRILMLLSEKREDPNTLEMEDADYSWLVKRVDEIGAKVIGLMAFRLKEGLVSMSKEERESRRNGTKEETTDEEEE